MMKVLRQFMFLAVLMVGFSLTAAAQRQDDRKTPPKENRPTIPVKPKNDDKKPDKPKDDKRDDDRRRPGMAVLANSNETEVI